MRTIVLRLNAHTQSPQDLQVNVHDNTFEYLETSDAPEIRVSAYLDRDIDQVESHYAEIFVSETCGFTSQIKKLTPGSRVRKNITLPGPMKAEEQLVLLVERSPKEL